MKHLLYKKLTVLQVLAIAVVSLMILFFTNFFYFNIDPSYKKNAQVKKDSVVVKDTIVKRDTSSFGNLKYALDTLTAKTELTHAGFGFCLMSPDSGRIILEYNSKQSLVPASVMKTLSCGTALAKLGAGFRYVTRLQYDGEIDKATHTLNGNIYIMGNGDPSLASDVFGENATENLMKQWTAAIKQLGIDSVNGSIVGDASLFEQDLIPVGWSWEDMQSNYAVGPCGLSFRENMYDIKVSASEKGVYFRSSPPVPGLILHNQLFWNKAIAKSYLYVSGAPYQEERTLLGEVNGAFEDRSAVPDPALYCAYTLMKHLQKNNLKIKDSCSTVLKLKFANKYFKKERKTFHSTYSPSLAQLVYHTLQVSQNFYAETFLRTLALADGGFGSTASGVAAVIHFFKEKKIDLHGFFMVDGSGVSRYDAISTKFLCDMLTAYSKDSSMFKTFYDALPVAGESGTMRNIANETSAAGNIHAKSGYMSRVRSYAGYVHTKSGKMLVFAMIMNNQGWEANETRDRLEKMMVLMAELK